MIETSRLPIFFAGDTFTAAGYPVWKLAPHPLEVSAGSEAGLVIGRIQGVWVVTNPLTNAWAQLPPLELQEGFQRFLIAFQVQPLDCFFRAVFGSAKPRYIKDEDGVFELGGFVEGSLEIYNSLRLDAYVYRGQLRGWTRLRTASLEDGQVLACSLNCGCSLLMDELLFITMDSELRRTYKLVSFDIISGASASLADWSSLPAGFHVVTRQWLPHAYYPKPVRSCGKILLPCMHGVSLGLLRLNEESRSWEPYQVFPPHVSSDQFSLFFVNVQAERTILVSPYRYGLCFHLKVPVFTTIPGSSVSRCLP